MDQRDSFFEQVTLVEAFVDHFLGVWNKLNRFERLGHGHISLKKVSSGSGYVNCGDFRLAHMALGLALKPLHGTLIAGVS